MRPRDAATRMDAHRAGRPAFRAAPPRRPRSGQSARGKGCSQHSLFDDDRVACLNEISGLGVELRALVADDANDAKATIRAAFADATRRRNRLQDRHIALEGVRPGIANETHDEDTFGLRHEDGIAVTDCDIARQLAALDLTEVDCRDLRVSL